MIQHKSSADCFTLPVFHLRICGRVPRLHPSWQRRQQGEHRNCETMSLWVQFVWSRATRRLSHNNKSVHCMRSNKRTQAHLSDRMDWGQYVPRESSLSCGVKSLNSKTLWLSLHTMKLPCRQKDCWSALEGLSDFEDAGVILIRLKIIFKLIQFRFGITSGRR